MLLIRSLRHPAGASSDKAWRAIDLLEWHLSLAFGPEVVLDAVVESQMDLVTAERTIGCTDLGNYDGVILVLEFGRPADPVGVGRLQALLAEAASRLPFGAPAVVVGADESARAITAAVAADARTRSAA